MKNKPLQKYMIFRPRGIFQQYVEDEKEMEIHVRRGSETVDLARVRNALDSPAITMRLLSIYLPDHGKTGLAPRKPLIRK
jgi:hypothetical protein